MQRFLPSLTFTIVFVHESLEGKENYKDDWRMGRCGDSALVFLLWNSYNSWISISKFASLGCFHVASGRLENNAKLNKASFYFHPWQLTYARIVSHPLGTHSFSRHTFSCLLRGFLFPLESFAILSLHTFVRTLEELTRQEAEELDPHEHAVLSNPAKILACEFYSRTGCKTTHTGQLQPTEFNVEIMKNWKKPPVS